MLLVPNFAAKDVDGFVAVRFEVLAPVGQEALVDVMMAALKGNCRGEQDHRRVTHEGCDEAAGRLLGQMFGDFKADDEIESLAQVKPLLEIADPHELGRNLQQRGIEPRAVDALYDRDAVLSGACKPRGQAASDIQD